MQLSPQITFRGMAPSLTLDGRIRSKVQKLERFYGRITSCHVSVEASNRDHQVGHQFQVHLALTVPGAELVASRESGKDHGAEGVYVAVREAFAAITRQLEDYVRKQRGDVKRHEASDVRARF